MSRRFFSSAARISGALLTGPDRANKLKSIPAWEKVGWRGAVGLLRSMLGTGFWIEVGAFARDPSLASRPLFTSFD